ncbi:MAG: regulatory protein RecX [Gemmiger sp.]|nr:regulatory protein RecX [Gemmiger sp.]
MPRITDIKETKRGRYALFLDGEFAFSLDEATFAGAGLHIDDEPEEYWLHTLQSQSDTRKALDKAMDLLSLRDHAAGELYQKLCRKFDPPSAAAAVAKAQELGLLNDESFARRRAGELLRKRKSRREILSDLSQKGVDRAVAATVVEELFTPEPPDPADPDATEGENPELATARALVARQYAYKLAQGKRQNVAAALARRGFAHSVIRAVLDEAEAENQTDTDGNE